MIAIEIFPGEFLDLYPDTRINFKLNNPIFGTGDFIPGEYSLPFDIPLTDKNARLLGHLDVIENRSILGVFRNVRLWFDGLQVKQGSLVIRPIKPWQSVAANFRFGLTTLAETLKSTSIRELCDQTIMLFDGSSYTKTFYIQFTMTGLSKLTVGDVEYSYNVVTGSGSTDYNNLAGLINADTDQHNAVATYRSSGGPFSGEHLEVTPSLNSTDITTPLSINGATILDVRENYEDHFNLFNNAAKAYLNAGSEPDDVIRFWMYHNTGLSFKDYNGLGFPVNFSFDDVSDTYFVSNTRTSNKLAVVPLVTVKHVFDQIMAGLNLTIRGSFIDSDRYSKDVLFNSLSTMESVPYWFRRNMLFHKDSIQVADHLPDLKVNEFIKAFQSRYGLALIYEERSQSLFMEFISDILADPEYNDITDKAGIITDVTNGEHTGVRIEAKQDPDDGIAGTDTYSFGSNVTLSLTSTIASIVNERFTRPLVSQESKEPKVIKVLQENQVVGVDDNDAAPQALGDLAAYLDPYLRMLIRGKEVRADVMFNPVEIFSIDWKRKQRIDQINYLIKEADVTLTMKGMEPVGCVLMAL